MLSFIFNLTFCRWTKHLKTSRFFRIWMMPGWRWDQKSRTTWRPVWRFSCWRLDLSSVDLQHEGLECNDTFYAGKSFFKTIFFCDCNRNCWGVQKLRSWWTCVWKTQRGRRHGSFVSCPRRHRTRRGNLEHRRPGWTSTTTLETPSAHFHKSPRFSTFTVVDLDSTKVLNHIWYLLKKQTFCGLFEVLGFHSFSYSAVACT